MECFKGETTERIELTLAAYNYWNVSWNVIAWCEAWLNNYYLSNEYFPNGDHITFREDETMWPQLGGEDLL